VLNEVTLRLADLARPILSRLGVDHPQFRAVLETKLTLDTRRHTLGFQQQAASAQKKKPPNTLAATVFFYTIMGFVMGGMLSMASPLVGLTIIHAFIMVMVAMSLIADFTTVLLDPTDNHVLLPRPVDGRTILMARIAHITSHLSLITLSLGGFSLVFGAFAIHPLFPLVFFLTLVLSTLFVIFMTNLLYLVIMQFTTGERFRDFLLYFQVAVTVIVVGGYQVIPRALDSPFTRSLRIDDKWWIYLSPPTWMAAPVDLLAGAFGWPQIILTLEAVLMPVLGIWLVARFLAPRFNRELARLQQTPTGDADLSDELGARATSGSIASRLARRVSRSPRQQAVFELIWHLCGRDRQFKLRAYSALAFLFVFAFIILLLNDPGGVLQAYRNLPPTNKHLVLLYFGCASISSILMQVRFTTQPEAAWIYYALPFQQPGEILMGAMKVIIARFVLLPQGILALICLGIWGPAIGADLLLAMAATLLLAMLYGLLLGRELPFSQTYSVIQASGRFMRSLLVLGVPAISGFGHFLLKQTHPSAVPLAAIPVLIAALILARVYRNTTWATLARQSSGSPG